MSTEKKIDPFAALILVISLIAIIVMSFAYFMGLYYPGYGNRYSCLSCGYTTAGDLAAQIFVILLFIIQIIIALNDLLPNPFIKKDIGLLGLVLAVLTILIVIVGAAIFIVTYLDYDTWPETGFYFGLIAGIINAILFFLKYKNK